MKSATGVTSTDRIRTSEPLSTIRRDDGKDHREEKQPVKKATWRGERTLHSCQLSLSCNKIGQLLCPAGVVDFDQFNIGY